MFSRYVALGDSQTEGLNDGDELTGYRGWADRLAGHLAAANPDLQYANLAVRGKLVRQIRAEQLDVALARQPYLATVVGGVNDMIRPKVDIAAVLADLDAMIGALTKAGATVATTTFPDVSKIAPVTARLIPRFIALNAGIREIARAHGAVLVEAWGVPVTTDARMWSADRIHATSEGHARIAAAFAEALGLDGFGHWREPLPVQTPRTRRQAAAAEAQFVRAFLAPWVWRRIRGRSSGDGRTAKRPGYGPVG